jgi:hypothetical protein
MEAIIVAIIVGVSFGYLLHTYLRPILSKNKQQDHACGGCAIKDKCASVGSPELNRATNTAGENNCH